MMAEQKGYECDFVNAPSETYKCKVCGHYLREAQITECCGKNLCLPCLEKHKKDGAACPYCKKPAIKGSLNRRVRNIILDCKVYCPSKKSGCAWVDKLEKLDNHIRDCEYYIIACPIKCGDQIMRMNTDEHISKLCKMSLSTCKCGKKIERYRQREHLAVCLFAEVQCPFHIVGCKVQVLRKDTQEHLNTALPEHLAMVTKQSESLQSQVKRAKKATVFTRQKKLQDLDSEIVQLSEEIAKTEEKIESLEKVLQATEVEQSFIECEKEKVMNSCKAEIIRKDAEVQELKKQSYTVMRTAKVKAFGIPVERYRQVYSRPTPSVSLAYSPRIIFTVPGFTDKVNNDALWLSQPFYTHNRGYKMCLEVYCNGEGQGHSKWLSIYANIVKGEYDDQLYWPFTGSFTVQLDDRVTNSWHIAKKIGFNHTSDPQTARSRATDGYFCKRDLGYWNFALQKALFPNSLDLLTSGSKYVVNDSIQLSIFNMSVS